MNILRCIKRKFVATSLSLTLLINFGCVFFLMNDLSPFRRPLSQKYVVGWKKDGQTDMVPRFWLISSDFLQSTIYYEYGIPSFQVIVCSRTHVARNHHGHNDDIKWLTPKVVKYHLKYNTSSLERTLCTLPQY